MRNENYTNTGNSTIIVALRSAAFGILTRLRAKIGGRHRSPSPWPTRGEWLIASFEHVRAPPWHLQSGGQAVTCGYSGVLICEDTRDSVAENRRAKNGNAKAKRMSIGKGEGEESISLCQTSASYVLVVNVQMMMRPIA